jgi:hypothetical protein
MNKGLIIVGGLVLAGVGTWLLVTKVGGEEDEGDLNTENNAAITAPSDNPQLEIDNNNGTIAALQANLDYIWATYPDRVDLIDGFQGQITWLEQRNAFLATLL